MDTKTLEKDSAYSKYDVDGDGVVTDQELVVMKELSEIERAENLREKYFNEKSKK